MNTALADGFADTSGVGSQYAYTEQGMRYGEIILTERIIYRLLFSSEVPAKEFWSVVLYYPQTRSEVADLTTLPQQEQQAKSSGRKRGWLARSLFRAEGAGRQRGKLDSVRAGQRLVYDSAAVWSARTVVR